MRVSWDRRRRGIPSFLAAALIVLLCPSPSVAAPDDTGMRPGAPGGPCAGAYDVVVHGERRSCAHPDPTPPGVDHRKRDPVTANGIASEESAVAAASGSVPCYGDGHSGNRVQAIYAYPSGAADRYAQVVGSIRTWAAAADQVFVNSAAETGGVRHIRFVTDASCTLVVDKVVIPSASASDFAKTVAALAQAGFNRTDRKYLTWMDTNAYCGIADIMLDDSAGQTNANNGGRAQYARVDTGCWGLATQSVEAHELMHNLGGIQASAPHSTTGYHCWDESDRMCYSDSPGTVMQQVCPTSHENVFDCNHDDYFSTAPAAGSYLATRWNTANSGFLATSDPVPATAGRYVPLTPARILDTRYGTGATAAPVGPNQSISVQVTGAGGVPASGVSAVMLNVTVTQPTVGGYLTVYPTGMAVPLASNLNFATGETAPNMVMAKLGTGGKVSLYNAAGYAHVTADVSGWYSDGTGTLPTGGLYSSLPPARLLDTRNGTGGILGSLAAGVPTSLGVLGVGGVPASGVSAVLLNVTVTQPTLPSYLTVYPAGGSVPLASSLNFVGGQTRANMVVAKVGAGGQIALVNAVGLTHVVVDVNGWYSDGTAPPPAGGFTQPLAPARIIDTRNGTGGFSAAVGPGQAISLLVTGVGGVPASGVSAVMLNVTATGSTAGSFLTVYPSGSTLPVASNLNFAAGQTVPNLVMAKVGTGGRVTIFNAVGSTHVIADVAGWSS